MFFDHIVEVTGKGLPLLMFNVMTIRSSLHNYPSTKWFPFNESKFQIAKYNTDLNL